MKKNSFSRVLSRSYAASAWLLIRMAIRRQYRNTFLGMAWSLIQPLAYITVLSVVMSQVMRFAVHDYAVYLISGLIPWQFMVAGVTQSASAFTSRYTVLHHTILPRTLFVVADVGMHSYLFINTFLLGLLVTLVLKGFTPAILFYPIAFLPLYVTVLALAVAAAYLTPYFYDTPHLLNVAFQVLFWTVPIVYPLSAVPEAHHVFFSYNPIYMLLHPLQTVLYEGMLPTTMDMMLACLVAGLACLVSYCIFRALRRNIIYYL